MAKFPVYSIDFYSLKSDLKSDITENQCDFDEVEDSIFLGSEPLDDVLVHNKLYCVANLCVHVRMYVTVLL